MDISFSQNSDTKPETVKLWARIGVTVNVPYEVYEQLQNEEINSETMKNILSGKVGEVYLDGESYFPDIPENGKLAEVDFNFYDKDRKMAFLEPAKTLESFYYTFGTASQFPYKKGWVEVQAKDRLEADMFFRLRFPDVNKGILNCSSVYTEEEFKKVMKNYENTDWYKCHEVISGGSAAAMAFIPHSITPETQEPVKPSLSDKIKSAQTKADEQISGKAAPSIDLEL